MPAPTQKPTVVEFEGGPQAGKVTMGLYFPKITAPKKVYAEQIKEPRNGIDRNVLSHRRYYKLFANIPGHIIYRWTQA